MHALNHSYDVRNAAQFEFEVTAYLLVADINHFIRLRGAPLSLLTLMQRHAWFIIERGSHCTGRRPRLGRAQLVSSSSVGTGLILSERHGPTSKCGLHSKLSTVKQG